MVEQVVTIEGSITPSAELPRGERRTVLYTERIQKLVKKGYINIVVGPVDLAVTTTPEAAPADHTGVTASDPSGVTPLPTGDFAPAEVPQHPNETAQHEAPLADEQRADQFSSSAGATSDVQSAEHPTG